MLTLREAQDTVERLAPSDYYRDHYRGYETDYLAQVAELVDGKRPGLRVLEVGPGWGTLAVWMAARGYDVTVMDYLPIGTFIAHELLDETGILYEQWAIDQGPVAPELGHGYELVMMTQVIPHLKWSPVQALANVAAMMHPEGLLVTSALDAECYPHIHPAYGHWSDVPRWTPGATPTPALEVCMYTPESLGELLSGAFSSVRVWRPEGSTTMLAMCRWPRGEQ